MLGLASVFNKVSAENKSAVIVGDININLLDTTSNSYLAYTNCFSGFGYESLIVHPTRCATQTLLDHVLSNMSPSPQSGVVSCDISDHYPIFLTFPTSVQNLVPSFFTSVLNKEEFIDSIEKTDFSVVDSLHDPEDALQKFCDLILGAVSLNTKTIKCKKRHKYPSNPWVTQKLLECMRKKENMYKKTKKKPFNLALANRYKNFCNVLNLMLKDAKRRYYENEFSKFKNNPKMQWKLLNNFLNNASRNVPISNIIHEGRTFKQPDDIANAFSDYFSNLPTAGQSVATVNMCRSSHNFYLFPVTPDEVRATLLTLKDTSAGLDNVCAYHLKLVAHCVSVPLSIIINKIFALGIFPSFLKRAKIIPVFKKGDKHLISNYRPISILSSLSKVIEKLFANRLNNYLTKFNILRPCQFGFRSGSSTNLALLSLTDFIKKSFDLGMIVGSVFLDFTKAFDTINHDILFQKLESYGLTGPALNFLKNFLINREGSVCVNNAYSMPKIINQGVPQGSILGPLLFIIYINDLADSINASHCVLYADDTTVSSADKCLSNLTYNLNIVLTKVTKWCLINHLIINPSKTKFMIFRPPQKRVSYIPTISLFSNTISPCDSVLFLGVFIDSHLKFHKHIDHLRNKTAFGIRALIKSRPFFSRQALLSLYFAFVHSHITYGIVAWGNTYDCHLAPLQHIQNQALRIITNSSFRANACVLLQQNNVLSVRNLFYYNIATFLFQLRDNNLSYQFIDRQLLQNNNSTRFAANENYLLPIVRTNYGQMTSAFAAISFWNSLSTELKSSSSLFSFKHMLKTFLLNR